MELTFENCIFSFGKVHLEALSKCFFSWETAFGSKLAQDAVLFCWLTKPLSSVPRMGVKSGRRPWDKTCKSCNVWSTVCWNFVMECYRNRSSSWKPDSAFKEGVNLAFTRAANIIVNTLQLWRQSHVLNDGDWLQIFLRYVPIFRTLLELRCNLVS